MPGISPVAIICVAGEYLKASRRGRPPRLGTLAEYCRLMALMPRTGFVISAAVPEVAGDATDGSKPDKEKRMVRVDNFAKIADQSAANIRAWEKKHGAGSVRYSDAPLHNAY